MYTNINLEVIQDNAHYTGSNGVKYPRNFPKSEIAELFLVTETDRPTDINLVVEGFIIDETYTQVWNTRTKTAEELQSDINSFNANLDRQLRENDINIIRSFINSLDGDQFAIDKVNQHRLDQTTLRATRK